VYFDARRGDAWGFTHVDPFEDTESGMRQPCPRYLWVVSPTSIRSRILKANKPPYAPVPQQLSFTHVDPFEDTESRARGGGARDDEGFTHVDPFEDTESGWRGAWRWVPRSFHPRRSVRGY